jgi:hypothetical protein
MKRIVFTREVLLVEVERWCADPLCNTRTRLALTKDEARSYTGFECERCGLWRDDALAERDIPEWWEELKITSLEGVRERPRAAGEEDAEGPVARLSEAWARLGEEGAGRGAGGDEKS